MKSIALAFIKAKKEFRPALKNNVNPAYRSKYADLAACIDAVDDAFLNNGIVMYQETFEDASGITVETVLLHESGESIRCGKLHIPCIKQDPQGYGSAMSYCRRYSLMAACGIAPEDDDGNAAQGKNNNKSAPSKGNGRAAAPDPNNGNPHMISQAQRQNVFAIIGEKAPYVKNDRETVLQVLAAIFSRNFDSTNDLTSGEASTLISDPDLLAKFLPTEAEYKTIVAKRKGTPNITTVPCPNRENKPVDEMECASCKNREGCPSWT